MTVLQFEPLLWKDITDYPDLGCAMLMGSYRKNGIDARLICTQSLYIKNLFLNELSCLVKSYKSAPDNIKIKYSDLKIEDVDFENSCKRLYSRYYSHLWKDYFDAQLTTDFKNLFIRLTALQFDLIKESIKDVPLINVFINTLNNNPSRIAAISLYEMTDENLLVLRILRCAFPDLVFIIGGAFTSHLSQSDIAILQDIGIADYLSIGPGELVLPELIRSIIGGAEAVIPNIVPLKRGAQYKLAPVPVRDLNQLASPDYSESHVAQYACPHPLIPLQTARGCIWRKCTFCSHHMGYYGEYHTYKLERLVSEMKYFDETYGCKWFILHDDDIPVKRLLMLGKMLYEQKLHYRVYAYVRADSDFLIDGMANQLYKYGIRGLSFGIESGSQNILNMIHKGIVADEVRQILKTTSDAGISNTCWMMINLPKETKDDLDQSIEFMTQTSESVDLWLLSPFRPQYDSQIYGSMDHTDELPRPPFSCSVPLNEKQFNEEKRITDYVNNLYSSGLFENSQIPLEILPIGAQRVRLVPFLFRDCLSFEECLREPFQLYSSNKVLQIGKKYFLLEFGKKTIISESEAKLWSKLLHKPLILWEQLTNEERDFVEKALLLYSCKAFPVYYA